MNIARCMIIHDPAVIAVAEVRLRAVMESTLCYAANDGNLLPVLPTLQYSGETLACFYNKARRYHQLMPSLVPAH